MRARTTTGTDCGSQNATFVTSEPTAYAPDSAGTSTDRATRMSMFVNAYRASRLGNVLARACPSWRRPGWAGCACRWAGCACRQARPASGQQSAAAATDPAAIPAAVPVAVPARAAPARPPAVRKAALAISTPPSRPNSWRPWSRPWTVPSRVSGTVAAATHSSAATGRRSTGARTVAAAATAATTAAAVRSVIDSTATMSGPAGRPAFSAVIVWIAVAGTDPTSSTASRAPTPPNSAGASRRTAPRLSRYDTPVASPMATVRSRLCERTPARLAGLAAAAGPAATVRPTVPACRESRTREPRTREPRTPSVAD
ncbi:MAG TPA: hypothetical protein VFM55_16445 [Micromonosporaceae bacterium]|nr:hypothetical protein [Micromonosporaceae bacterium]